MEISQAEPVNALTFFHASVKGKGDRAATGGHHSLRELTPCPEGGFWLRAADSSDQTQHEDREASGNGGLLNMCQVLGRMIKEGIGQRTETLIN